MDPRLSVQKKMVEVLKAAGFPYRFVVTPNIGHWFPQDLDKKIDDAISHITHR
jgi:dipeptidyl aminopeptidase/acylaminoacyl peptidase